MEEQGTEAGNHAFTGEISDFVNGRVRLNHLLHEMFILTSMYINTTSLKYM